MDGTTQPLLSRYIPTSDTAHEIHYDYNYRGSGCAGWRIYQNGRIEPKG